MDTKPYHEYQTIACIPNLPWIPNHTMDTKLYHGYQTIPCQIRPWISNNTMALSNTLPRHIKQYFKKQLRILLYNVPIPTLPCHATNFLQIVEVKFPPRVLYIEVRISSWGAVRSLHNGFGSQASQSVHLILGHFCVDDLFGCFQILQNIDMSICKGCNFIMMLILYYLTERTGTQ